MALGCAAATQARAESWLQFEAGVGAAAYQRASDGLWVQNGMQHQLQLTAPAVEAGLAADVYQGEHFGVTLHADYEWMATVRTQSLAVSDAHYDATQHACTAECSDSSNFVTSGHDYGVAFMIEPHYDFSNGWRVGVTGGPYVHKSPFSVDITGPNDAYVAHIQNEAGWQLGYVLGLNVSYKRFGLAYRYFANGGHLSDSSPTPPIWRATHTLMATWRVNVF